MKTVSIMLPVVAAVVLSQPAPREQVGPVPGGGYLLNSGWRIRPAGTQVPLDTLPMATALSPDGRHLLVLNGGYKPPSISVLEVASARETSRVKVPDGWLGLAFSPKGDRVYVGGGSRAAVFEFSFSGGVLQPTRAFPVVPEDKRTGRDFIGDVTVSPDGRMLYAADLYHDAVLVINLQSGRVVEHFASRKRPYRILFHPDGKSYFVTGWADGTLGHYQASDGALIESVRLGPHPTDILWSGEKRAGAQDDPGWAARLFITASNTNTVYVLGVAESKQLRIVETLNVAMTPRQPAGMTPSALALSADGKRVFVVCSDANTVAVANIAEEDSRIEGFIPAGWYPTAARALADGRLVVLNGKGVRSYPNPQGPNPVHREAPSQLGIRAEQYVGLIQTGTASFIDPFDQDKLDEYTKTVMANSPYRDELLDRGPEGLPKGIEHVIYIVKENRTYDQVFGDMKEGNGDPSLVLFGEDVSPNHRKLAREFVLLDNFYVNSDVSADGHNWSTAAIAPDYVQKMWPSSYGGRRKVSDYMGLEAAASPPAGYLWTNAAAAGVSMRNYGYAVANQANAQPGGPQVSAVRDPVLRPVTNMNYRSFDLKYPDVERAKVFLKDLEEFEKTGTMPRLILMRLGNDHTSGTAAGAIAPLSAFADNDYALGTIIEALSRSRFWASTAIFILEDDAQNGADHVDSHRSPAFVISPFVRRHSVDSSMYNTASILRTMELLLGLKPMTHFDAGARVMTACFGQTADTAPYTAEKPRIPLDRTNPVQSATAARSARLDFSAEDLIDDDELNDILWRAIRAGEPPAPVRSIFAR